MTYKFTLLNAVHNEDKIDKLMDGFATKFIGLNEIELNDNPENVSSLKLEANIYVVDKETTHTKELGIRKGEKCRGKYPNHIKTEGFSALLR